MQCAICWNYLLTVLKTKNISVNNNLPNLVKYSKMKWNQPVTNVITFSSKQVETSETTRTSHSLKNIDNHNLKFYQWLAGLIDGNGCLLISKSGYSSCEITVELQDEKMLRIIQNKFGGSIKL